MKLFEVIVVSKGKDDLKPEIILPLKQVFAKDENHVRLMAAQAVPATWEGKLAEVDIRVRPF